MKVLWLGHFVPWPPVAGALIRSYHLVREANRSFEVALLCLNQKARLPRPDLVEQARAALSEHCASVEIQPIPAEERPRPRERVTLRSTLLRRSYDEVWLSSPPLRARLKELVETLRPDLVHFDTVGLAPYASVLPQMPLVLNHHNIESQMMERRATLEPSIALRALLRSQARALVRLERSAADRFHSHLVVSELDGDRLAALIPGARVVVIPNGVDLEYFQPLPPSRQFQPRSIVFAGGLDWYPNRTAVWWLIKEIFPRLRARFPDASATIIGRNPPAEFLHAAKATPGLRFTGFVDDIRPLIADAAVYACPIFDGGGTRLKILDTLAQQIPLVATTMAVEGVGVVSGQHALLADTADEFVDAVARIFDDPTHGSTIAAAGRLLAEQRFGWESIGRRLSAAYRAAIDDFHRAGRSQRTP